MIYTNWKIYTSISTIMSCKLATPGYGENTTGSNIFCRRHRNLARVTMKSVRYPRRQNLLSEGYYMTMSKNAEKWMNMSTDPEKLLKNLRFLNPSYTFEDLKTSKIRLLSWSLVSPSF